MTLGGALRPPGADTLLAGAPGSSELAGLTTRVPGVPHTRGCSVSWAPVLAGGGVPAPGSGQTLHLRIFIFLFVVCSTEAHLGPETR